MSTPDLPENPPISPITLVCPLCHAKPYEDCSTPSGNRLLLIHLARVTAAAKLDGAAKNGAETEALT